MRTGLRRRFLFSVILAMAATSTAGPEIGGTRALAATCSVTNASTHARYTDLQGAIDFAAPKATLVVTGTCTGNFKVGRDLTLRAGGSARPVLSGQGGTVLTATGGNVVVRGLRITGGSGGPCPRTPTWTCGGGVLHDGGTLRLVRSIVSGNTLSVASLGHGAGVYNGLGELSIEDSTISGNSVTASNGAAGGGGIANQQGTLTLTRTTVRDNSISSSCCVAMGGGILNDGVLTIVDSTISGNTATAAGTLFANGGGISSRTTMTIVNSTVSGNTVSASSASSAGGGIHSSGTASVTATTITSNRATSGTGSANAGGISNGGRAQLAFSIVAGNVAGTADPDCLGAFVSGSRNLIGIGSACGGVTDGVNGDRVGTAASPRAARLGPLANNGGPTRTHALRAGSPAIDGGGPRPCTRPRDQRGTIRPQGPACDIGAYERR